MAITTSHALEAAADALEVEAKRPRNKKYRQAYEISAAHYRAEAKRLAVSDSPAGAA